MIIGTVLGVSLGMLSGLGGGILDNIIMVVAELQQSIPRTLILIVVVVLVRPVLL